MKTSRFTHADLLRYTGLFTYACMGIPLLLELYYLPNWLSERWNRGWVLSYLLFGVGYWWLSQRVMRNRRAVLNQLVLAMMVVAGLSIGFFSKSGLHAMFLMIVAVLLPWFMSLTWGMLYLIAMHLAAIPLFKLIGNDAYDWVASAYQGLLYFGMSSFAFITSYVARQQAEAREEQRRLNNELRATRALLAESSRMGERMRISRDLHDLVGHHLTALSLNLEVASHKVNEGALEHVRQAQSVAKLLLADVREVVSQLRQDDAIELKPALKTLVEGVPSIRIHMDIPEDFSVSDPRRAHVLLRCAQEIITNAVKHAKARNLWLRFATLSDGRQQLHARDDGVGCDKLAAGNGLNGMRERLAEIGGELSFDTAPGKGFALEATLPKHGS